MITLIFCGDLRVCPYLKRYTERLDKANCPYEVLFWNRSGVKLEVPSNYYWFEMPSDETKQKYKKLLDFYKYRRWVKKHLNSHPADGIVILSTLPGVLLADVLKQYRKQYILDIRDYSYESVSFFRKAEETLIRNSFCTVISSRGFQMFLPDYEYVIAHNFDRHEIAAGAKFKREPYPLKLVWHGTIRHFDHQKKIIDALKNDNRFELMFHGTGDIAQCRAYCRENGVMNVTFAGPYDNSEKEGLLAGTAIINNSYGDVNKNTYQYLMPNRYYDGLIYHIPQFTEEDSFKAKAVKTGGVGIALKIDETFADNLIHYYENLDSDAFDEACEASLRSVIAEDDLYIEKIDAFIQLFNKKCHSAENI